MWTDFIATVAATGKHVILNLNPQFEKLPLPITRFDDPFFPFSKEIITVTQDLVAGYMFDMASYLAMGGAGAVALERSIRYVPRDRVTILHGPFTGTGFSPMSDVTGFGVDAITITEHQYLDTYLSNPPHAAFVNTAFHDELPAQGGIYAPETKQISYRDAQNQTTTLTVTDDSVLYSTQQMNYADVVREQVSKL